MADAAKLILAYDLLVDAPETDVDADSCVTPSDPFRDEAVRCMASELECNSWLVPKSWRTARPHLELVSSIGRDKVLRVEVRPWRQYKHPVSGTTSDGREDFATLREGQRPAPLEVMRFDLGCVGSQIATPASEHETKVLALQRKIVFRLYERAVGALARRFVTRVHSGLVCFGPANELTVRESATGDEVEIANLLTDRSSDWHLTLPKLCARLGVRPDEVLVLFRTRLADLSFEGQAQTLLEFSGRQPGHGSDMTLPHQLACSLGAICGTQGRTPLRPGEQAAVEALERMAAKGSGELLVDMRRLYGLDEVDAWSVIRLAHPTLYRSLDRSARRWRLEIEAVDRGEFEAWETPNEMARRMVEQLQAEASNAAMRWDVQLRRVAATMNMDAESLKAWGVKHAPAVTAWVGWMRDTKGGKITKRRSADPA